MEWIQNNLSQITLKTPWAKHLGFIESIYWIIIRNLKNTEFRDEMYAIVGFCASCAKNTFTLDDIFSSTWVLGQEFFNRISNALYWYECHLYSHLNRQPTEEIFKFILAQFSWNSLVAVVPLSPDEFTSSTKTNYRKSDISYQN